ncbi:ImmA/IrrE family metallo-endopeptidase [Verrucomicrobiales bacterium BCK34]|nr:ImmA/IrrE family metallo-endopeptidase [Verrucomicrobiales bacterium BCK34]
MTLKLIKNSNDYAEALKQIQRLLENVEAKGVADFERIELLSYLIEKYEKETLKVALPTPVEAIRFAMDQSGLRQQDLVPFIGSKSRVSEVLSGKRPLTLSMIRGLHEGLGIRADVLLQEPGETLPSRISVDDYPVREMHKRNWFSGFPSDWKDAKDHKEEMLQSLFQGRENDPIGARNRQSLKSKSKVDENALHAWRCFVIDKAMSKKLPTYDPNSLNDEFISWLKMSSRLPDGPLKAIEEIEERGIPVVIEERLDKTFLDGAAIQLPDGRPMIGLTLRYNRLDNFWFTLFHELAHVKLHLGTSNNEGYWDTDIDSTSENAEEREADEFALNSFISDSDWEEIRDLKTAEEIRDKAKQLMIHESIIAGRLRREAQDYRRHRTLVGQGQVKKLFKLE